MSDTLVSLAPNWQSFFLLIGSAAAALVGLMFVALSILSPVISRNEQRRVALRTFVTPSLINFVYILVIAAVVMIPSLTRTLLAILMVITGLTSFAYSLQSIPVMRRSQDVDRQDWTWHLFVPVFCYLLLVASSISLFMGSGEALALNALALVTILLLVAGIRNAWDLVTYTMLRPLPAPTSTTDSVSPTDSAAAVPHPADAGAPAHKVREEEPTSLALPASQQADVIGILQGQGLDPADFTWAIQPSRFALIGPLVSALVHTPTGGFFRFEFRDPSGQSRVSIFTPGEEGRETTKTAESWESQLDHIRMWGKYVRQPRR